MPSLATLCQELSTELAKHGFSLSAKLAFALATYLQLLLKWNQVINLCGAKEANQVISKLIPDSFYLRDFLQSLNLQDNLLIADLGAGAGLPGIPLRLGFLQGHYLLMEQREKRVIFLQNVLATLNLPKTTVIAGPCQDYFKKKGILADLLLSRAFLPPDQLLPFSRPLLKAGGLLLLLTNNPPANWPSFQMLKSQSYQIMGQKRYLTCLKAL
ncbi:MAG: class I SAM-dependent methyltransferase [Desulfovibrio sp.]|nr:class I SAM-dependent methyltransferase [Desulfovibrio sp.]